jgi:hypothetical protein
MGEEMKKVFQVTATPDHGFWFLQFPGTTDFVSTALDIPNIEEMAKDLLNLATDVPIDEIELEITLNDFQTCETEEFKEYDRERGTVHSCEFVKHLV